MRIDARDVQEIIELIGIEYLGLADDNLEMLSEKTSLIMNCMPSADPLAVFRVVQEIIEEEQDVKRVCDTLSSIIRGDPRLDPLEALERARTTERERIESFDEGR